MRDKNPENALDKKSDGVEPGSVPHTTQAAARAPRAPSGLPRPSVAPGHLHNIIIGSFCQMYTKR